MTEGLIVSARNLLVLGRGSIRTVELWDAACMG